MRPSGEAALRFLLSGAGSIAKRHAVNLLHLEPDAELLVVTRDPVRRLMDWPRGVKAVTSFEHGLAEQPDAVMICSASSRHAQELAMAVRLGLPTFVEKPLLTDSAYLSHVTALLDSAHPACAVGCNLRFLPSLGRLKTALHERVIGPVVRAHLEVGQWLPDWRPGRPLASSYSADAAAGGGVVFDLVHEIDAALWLLGDLTLVGALGGQFSSLPIRAADTLVALLRTATGHPVTVSLDYVSRRPVRRYVFVGEGGTLTWDLPSRQLLLTTANDEQTLCVEPDDFAVVNTYPAELVEWLNAIRAGTEPLTSSLRMALPTARLMLLIAERTS